MKIDRDFASCPECGCLTGKARSIPDLRRFHSVCRKAWMNWPEWHFFQAPDADTLRYWLEVQVGWFVIEFMPYPDITGADAAAERQLRSMFRQTAEAGVAAARRRWGYAELRVSSGGAEILFPKSISVNAADQKEFNPIRDKVEALIESIVGVSAQELLDEKAA